MTETIKNTDKPNVCLMKIGFSVTNDDAALDIKKKIDVLLKDIPDAQNQFSIIPARSKYPYAPQV